MLGDYTCKEARRVLRAIRSWCSSCPLLAQVMRSLDFIGGPKVAALCGGFVVVGGLGLLAAITESKIVWVIAAGFIIVGIWWLAGTWLRLIAHELRYSCGGSSQRVGQWLDQYFFVVTLLQVGAVVLVVLVTTALVFSPDDLPGASVVAVATVAFLFVQAPRLAPPTVKVWFLTGDSTRMTKAVFLPPDSNCVLRLRMFNLSLNSLDRCTARLWLPEGFQVRRPVDQPNTAANKNVLFESDGSCAAFHPDKNHMDVAAGDYLDFVVALQDPATSGWPGPSWILRHLRIQAWRRKGSTEHRVVRFILNRSMESSRLCPL